MKLTILFKICIILLFTGKFFNIYSAYTQTPVFNDSIVLNQDFSTDTTIYPFNGDNFFGIEVSGNIHFNSDTSLVRLIITDTTGLEYMIYETYPMLDTLWNFSFEEKCEETCFLDGFMGNSFTIQIVDADIQINGFYIATNPVSDATLLQKQAKQLCDEAKIEKLNAFIKTKKMIWKAGQTNLSKLFHRDKIKAFGLSKNSFGFEYYVGGVFSIYGLEVEFSDPTYGIAEEFDWREIHDANISGTPYYDDDDLGGGWMTSIKCQNGCWTQQNGWECIEDPEDCLGEWLESQACYGFAVVATTEALVNLYFNNHFDFDLSEQQTLSNPTCGSPLPCGGIASGSSTQQILDLLKNYGLVNETDFPFRGKEISCDNMLTPTEIVQIDYESINITGEDIKKSIINYGPLVWTGGEPWASGHAMSLVGYGVVREGDVFYNEDPVPATSSYVGRTYWIMKNSYGTYANQSQNGYYYFFFHYPPARVDRLLTPFYSLTLSEDDRNYYDKDNDGYYNWGVGEKNSNWPVFPDEKDGNDNDATLGPVDENGNITITGFHTTSFEKTLDGWLQCGYDDDDFFIHQGPPIYRPEFGPNAAQDGDFYLYMDGDHVGYAWQSVFLESPFIDLNNYCGYSLNFWYHKCISWGGDGSKLEVSISFDNGNSWKTYWGVYGNTNPLDCDWTEIHLNIPKQANKLRFEAKTGSIDYQNNIAIDNISIVPVDLSVPWVINQNIVINNGYAVCDDIIIESAGTLTLQDNCTLYLQQNKKIIVKPGGKLEVMGAVITTSSQFPWQGIEVWGNPELNQTPANQGILSITNGGTIENALVAVRLGRTIIPDGEGEIMYGDGGGLLFAADAVLRNNRTGVVFETYSNNNISYFNRCTFETTRELTGGETPGDFIKFYNISGVDVKGCTFQNTRENTVPFNQRGNGIYSFNSTFLVDEICISGTAPCTEYRSTVFSGLNYGVKAYGISPNRTCTVKHSIFDENKRGIYLSAVPYPTVEYNNFTMSVVPTDGSTADTLYGIYLDHCSGYTVEENQVYSDQTHSGGKIAVGTIINQSGEDNNIIYNNYFEKVYAGVLAQNENRSRNGSTGLVVKCNEFNQNSFDLVVTSTGGFSTPQTGIAASQGANLPQPDAPAGNRFSWTGPEGTATDIYNEANDITYYYHVALPSLKLQPLYYTDETVLPIPNTHPNAYWDPDESCPPSNGGGGGSGDTEEFKSRMATSGYKADSVQNIINILVDGGSTEDLKWEVDMSAPPETYQVYNELMNNSPYLSDTVVEAAIEKETVLLNVMLRDVMVANPQSAKNYELMNKIDERFDPMPAYMKAQILQGRSLVSAFEELQSSLAFYRQQRTLAFNALVKYYLTDTLNPVTSADSLMVLLENENSLNAKYRLAFLNMEHGAWSMGQSVLNSIPELFNLTNEELEVHQQLVSYFNLLIDLAQEGKAYAEADSAQLETLFGIEASQKGVPSIYARDVLLALDEIVYEEQILLPDLLKSAAAHQEYEELKQALQEHHFLKVFPNPAGDYLIIEHNLEIEPKDAYVEIRNTKGEILKHVIVEGKQNQQTVDIKALKPGVYITSLYVDSKKIESLKFTKVK